ncbi:universal stress protein [Streptomyces pluripotens]|uniref:Universal stress protein n=1 Tax=Streptomyces pluripotens TaxID=1355015 RepID=A0A221NSS8_9ACTN|nr:MULTISPECIES: universal stress protein [Streptomyces]ASN22838.1 universal stress protein [Streptomyces pluripotens]KIE23335.1 universal stress protein [Streptomyces sp. MUSC 125]MCH0558235.1 universal stress protein [Streptomyces sp. MUM 16J]
MTIPVVVGVDGSEASLEAVGWAAVESARHGVPLHILHAAAGGGEAAGLIATASGRARQSAPTVRLSSEVVADDAASALIDKGRDAFALVLGSRGVGGLAEMLLGSVSLAVAARAECPVVVVRGQVGHRNDRFGSVVVGVEDEESSGAALQFAFREARVRHCRMVAVHAWSAPAGACTTPQAPSWPLEAHRRPPTQVLDDTLRGPTALYRDVPVERRLVEEPARRALLEAASEADLLVVGARPRLVHSGLQLGLINHALLHHAPCPIAVVPQI